MAYKHDPRIHNYSAARQILPFIFKLKPIHSILDVGCGTGTWLAVAKDLGIEQITGIDGADLNNEDLKIAPGSFSRQDLTTHINLNKKFDLLLCLEVAEHLPESAAKTIVSTLVRHSDFILFSAAIPGQGGQNHLNEQWPAYWQKLFADQGYYPSDSLRNFFWENEEVEWWYKQNMLIYAPLNVLTALNLPVNDKVESLVHPDLLEEKQQIIAQLNQTIQKEVWNPGVKSAFKRLVKSIIR